MEFNSYSHAILNLWQLMCKPAKQTTKRHLMPSKLTKKLEKGGITTLNQKASAVKFTARIGRDTFLETGYSMLELLPNPLHCLPWGGRVHQETPA